MSVTHAAACRATSLRKTGSSWDARLGARVGDFRFRGGTVLGCGYTALELRNARIQAVGADDVGDVGHVGRMVLVPPAGAVGGGVNVPSTCRAQTTIFAYIWVVVAL